MGLKSILNTKNKYFYTLFTITPAFLGINRAYLLNRGEGEAEVTISPCARPFMSDLEGGAFKNLVFVTEP